MSARSAPLLNRRKPSRPESYYDRRRSAISDLPINYPLMNHHQQQARAKQSVNSLASHHQKNQHRRTRSTVSSLFRPIHLPTFDKGLIPMHDLNPYKVFANEMLPLLLKLITLFHDF